MVSSKDHPEKKRPSHALIESEERLRLMVEAVKDYALFTLDTDGHIVSWNSGAERIKGYRESEILGKHFSIFYSDVLNAKKHPQFELAQALEFGRYEEEGVRLRKDGTSFHANVIITPLYDAEKNHRGFAKITRDITERKFAEDKLKKANEDLELRVKERTQELLAAKEAAEAANQAKSTFLANMSHEIRTPLGAVLGFSEMLAQQQTSDPEIQEYRDAVLRNGRLLAGIINDLLDLSKIEAGHLKIEKEDVSTEDLISQVGSLANLQAQDKGLEFSIESEGALPVTVNTDVIRLKQILLNIIGNAVKFTSRGKIKVIVSEKKLEGRNKLVFAVEDTGPGIDAKGIEKLFTPFCQVDSTLTRRFGGTGLGLALAKRLATALGGDVQLTSSKVGFGSVFTASIDTGMQRIVLYTDQHSASHVAKEKMIDSLEGLRILLVEDIYDNRMLIKKYLQNAGASVEVAVNGREGLEKSLACEYDLVLMDLSMPVMDGFEATERLRHGGYRKPIIALTAHALSDEKKRSLSSGFDDHITKPIERSALINRIAQLVAQATTDNKNPAHHSDKH